MQGQCKFQSPELATSFEMRAPTRRPPQSQVLRSVTCNGLSGRSLRRPLPAQRDAGLRVTRLRPGRPRRWCHAGGCCDDPGVTAAPGKL